ncbi:hypothetical protein PAXRUDRAFT_16324 [Paxillus rubicundulus Ve08.2h10]|uniref:Endonuclease/exonuclease/phosphatase domain-containing protein n=1 Tax=Paxillus rubicundulus Ve08.2h10 TaxID=930991 RepID=A0A0D0DEV2_9AGAM|nr:hypothetical protein PAXRUDRAFT_16324 [Paxillus rubicundulus Ve08.2h10]
MQKSGPAQTTYAAEHTKDFFINCSTNLALWGPETNHTPILSILELEIPHTQAESNRNFHNTDWEKFNKSLQLKLEALGPPGAIVTQEDFQGAAHRLNKTIQNTIEEVVPLTKPSPHSKWWWTHELTLLRREVAKPSYESYKARGLPDHPKGNELWIANKYISVEAVDGGPSRIPTLKLRLLGHNEELASTNEEKGTALASSFFPPPPDLSSVPIDYEYPTLVDSPGPITTAQIEKSIAKLSPYKAPGPDGISNTVLINCTEVLIPYLLPHFQTVCTLQIYHDPWREFIMAVL